jgi:hypothetical protein
MADCAAPVLLPWGGRTELGIVTNILTDNGRTRPPSRWSGSGMPWWRRRAATPRL